MSINLPEDTRIHKRLPKETFYKRLELTSALQEKFVSDIDRIFVENSLTSENLNLTQKSEINEILLLMLCLKKQDFDQKIAEAIARHNPHKLLFLLVHEKMGQLALYHGKLYRTQWMPEQELTLSANGFSLSEVWNGFIEQIALYEEKSEKTARLTIDERLCLQAKIDKLVAQIQKLEKSVWKERQPKKKFNLYTKLRELKKELEELKHGENEDVHP